MLNIIYTCHVEPERHTDKLSYLKNFFKKSRNLNFKIVYLLMYGEEVGEKLLKYCSENKAFFSNNCEIGLHVHGGETEKAIKAYKKYFGTYPKHISFGHWVYTDNDLQIAAKYGVRNDYSYSAYRHNEKYFTKAPFDTFGLKETPAACNPKYPINPFVTKYDFLISRLLKIIYFFSNKQLHFSFHSYDFK